MFFINANSISTLFIAGVLFFSVAPHLSLISKQAGLAIKLAAAALFLAPVLEFGMVFFIGRIGEWGGLPMEPWRMVPIITRTPFWLFLAWAVLATVQSARPKGAL
jgi:hypothetical protein